MAYLLNGVRGNGLMKRPKRPQIRHCISGGRSWPAPHAHNAGDVIETEL
jgi:hypothetical protein